MRMHGRCQLRNIVLESGTYTHARASLIHLNQAKNMPKELSRREVADRLGCSIATVQKLEREGKLTPRREKPKGHSLLWFNAAEVEKLASEWKPRRAVRVKVDSRLVESNVRGKVAAKVFRLLADPKAKTFDPDTLFRLIVIETEADPMLVRQLIYEWELGVKKAREKKQEEKQRAEEREQAREFAQAKRQEEYREWRLRMAEVEAKKRTGT